MNATAPPAREREGLVQASGTAAGASTAVEEVTRGQTWELFR